MRPVDIIVDAKCMTVRVGRSRAPMLRTATLEAAYAVGTPGPAIFLSDDRRSVKIPGLFDPVERQLLLEEIRKARKHFRAAE